MNYKDPEQIAEDVAQFVLNHAQNIEDEVSDFHLLKGMLESLREVLSE
jgi:hypothetical protein